MNCSGFNRESWTPRTNAEHREHVYRISQAKTQAERKLLKSSLGCRYSDLLDLPYFDAPRMIAITPCITYF